MPDEPTDEQVLAAPDDFTVDQVLDAFSRSTPDQVAAAKALEAAGRDRAGIRSYEPPPAAPVEPAAPRFPRDRILDPQEGQRIVGAKYSHIVGALHGDDSDDFTVEEVRAKIDELRNRPVATGQEA